MLKKEQLPLLVETGANKHHFFFDEQGTMHHQVYVRGKWRRVAESLFQEKLEGFDAALDEKDTLYLVGFYNNKLIIITASAGEALCTTPFITFREDSTKVINALTCCCDNGGRLHIICSTVAPDNNKEQNFFHLLIDKNEIANYSYLEFKEKPEDILCIFRFHPFSPPLLVYSQYVQGEKNLALNRILWKTKNEWSAEKIMNLPGSGEPGFLSVMGYHLNKLHLSWISRQSNITFLNYACMNSLGKLSHWFNIEVNPGTLQAPALYFKKEQLYLEWSDKNGLYKLISIDEGKNWMWGVAREPEKKLYSLRLRSNNISSGDICGNLTLAFGTPPEIPHRAVTAYSKEKAGSSDYIHTLETMSSFLLQRTLNLKRDAISLQEEIAKKDEEIKRLRYSEQVQKERLEKLENEHYLERKKTEALLRSAEEKVKNMEQKLNKEKVKLEKKNKQLQEEISLLKHESERKSAEISQKKKELDELIVQCQKLQKENAELKNNSMYKIIWWILNFKNKKKN